MLKQVKSSAAKCCYHPWQKHSLKISHCFGIIFSVFFYYLTAYCTWRIMYLCTYVQISNDICLTFLILMWGIPIKDFLVNPSTPVLWRWHKCISPVTSSGASIDGLKTIFVPMSFQSLSLLGNINQLNKAKPLEYIFNY